MNIYIEIADLRMIGLDLVEPLLGRFAILLSPYREDDLIADGLTMSTLSSASFTQVVFDFAVTRDPLVRGIIVALVIGPSTSSCRH